MLANIRVERPTKFEIPPKGKSNSLKSLQNVRFQIQTQERARRELQKAAKQGTSERKNHQLQAELQKAFAKLRGEKVHDSISLLRKAEKRLKRKKQKSAESWEQRKEGVKQSQLERQQKRKDNIEKFRGSKKKPARVAAVSATEASAGPKTNSSSRKTRRHENLMKFGPKKDRAEREEKRKTARKSRRKTEGRKPDRGGKKTQKVSKKGKSSIRK